MLAYREEVRTKGEHRWLRRFSTVGREEEQRVSSCSRELHMLKLSYGKEELCRSEETSHGMMLLTQRGPQVPEVVVTGRRHEGWQIGETPVSEVVCREVHAHVM